MSAASYTINAWPAHEEPEEKKRPAMVAKDWLLYWDYVPVHLPAAVTDWMAARPIKLIEHCHIFWTRQISFSFSSLRES
jgi:hypothetical protein